MDKIKNFLHQVQRACPICGSYYRIASHCNICKSISEITAGDDEPAQRFANKVHQGRQWNKKLHRYLTQKEISEGMRGG